MSFANSSNQYLAEASEYLASEGFTLIGASKWHGKFSVRGEQIGITIQLESFPSKLPEIYLDKPLKEPSLNISGTKICIGRPNVLLDIRNIKGIIRDSLKRAEDILYRAMDSTVPFADFESELLSYWPGGSPVVTLVDADDSTRKVLTFTNQQLLKRNIWAVVGEKSSLDRLLTLQFAISTIGEKYDEGLFLRLETPLSTDDLKFPRDQKASSIISFLKKKLNSSDLKETERFLSKKREGETSVLVLSVPGKNERSLIAIVGVPSNDGSYIYSAANVQRQDRRYLIQRGGASVDLLEKRVAIVGCGSVGSRIAEFLASTGVGEIRLIDDDTYEVYNTYRHVLGVYSAGRKKCCELVTFLSRRFPNIRVSHEHRSIQSVLLKVPTFVEDVDVIILATGNHSLELQLNQYFYSNQRKVFYAWVDPLGLWGHVLFSVGRPTIGCLECLYEWDSQNGIYNCASFAGPFQEFSRIQSGCGGAFVPFSILQAARIGLEASQLCSEVLFSKQKESILLSWFASDKTFVDAGFSMSPRAKLFLPGEVKRSTDFVKASCPVCSPYR